MASILITLTLIATQMACGEKTTEEVVTEPTNEPTDDTQACDRTVDPDCDGFTEEEGDCNPTDGLVYPGAVEIPYDGKDNDCSGDGDLNDVDGDGYIGTRAEGGTDCDDNNLGVYPGATEICYDGIDQDCAGDVELENTNDCDGDGFIGRGVGMTDCDDTNPNINPDAEEIWYNGIDENCDLEDDFDQDGDGDPIDGVDIDGDGVLDTYWDFGNDGFVEYEGGTDCDDTDPLTSLLLPERWDITDRDCDGQIDGLVARDCYVRYESVSGEEGGLGMSSLVIGDITGDGIAEIAVGAPYSVYDIVIDENGAASRENYKGAVYILDPTVQGSPANVAIAQLQGGTYSYTGWDMVSMGDVNGGGLNDIVVAAPGTDKALLFMGEDFTQGASLTLSANHASITALGFGGVDVALAGDINGDGIAEIAVGGSFLFVDEPAWVGIWDGATMAQGTSQGYADALYTIDSTGTTTIGGETVGGVDFNADGIDDIAVAYGVTGTGKVAFVSGADIALGGTVSHADLTAVNGATGTQFGRNNAVAPDIDGDGYAELVVSAGYANSTGSDGTVYDEGGIVYVIDGDELAQGGAVNSRAYIQIHGTKIAANLQVIDALGDNDGDGLTDIIVSGVNEDLVSNQPEIHTYMFRAMNINMGGNFDADSATSSIHSNQYSNDMFGYAATSADFDFDGDDDLLIGAPRAGYITGAGSQNFDGIFGVGNFYIFEADLH